jgi:hypothetical protein
MPLVVLRREFTNSLLAVLARINVPSRVTVVAVLFVL